MKKKMNGDFRARLNAHGFKQVEGMHYVPETISAPVTNPNTIRIAMTLWAMNSKWICCTGYGGRIATGKVQGRRGTIYVNSTRMGIILSG